MAKTMEKILLICCKMFFVLSLSSCAVTGGITGGANFELCHDYDFDKKFPGKDGRPIAVNYNTDRKMLYGKDGAEYLLSFGGKRKLKYWYQEDLEMSKKEEEYNKCFQVKEEEFDELYAGDIKRKLFSVSKKFVARNGEKRVVYPIYLEGDKLPQGLQSPSSFFSGSFISYVMKGAGRSDDLRDYILSTELIKDAGIRELAGGIASDICGQFLWAYEGVFGEYVMTYYNLKKYNTISGREKVFSDLANYYGNLAFRSSAEALFESTHVLNSIQRKRISEYFSNKVFDYILSYSQKEFVNFIKSEYQNKIQDHCEYYLLMGRYEKKSLARRQKKISKKEYMDFANSIKRAIASGKERCVND